MPATTFRDLRLQRGLTVRQVQEKTEIHIAYISEIERGRRWPTPQQLAVLSEFYGVAPEDWKWMLVMEVER